MHELLIELLTFFVGASVLLYITLGGADFGAGIIELLPAGDLRDRQTKTVNHAMGPVWEANHMWLILLVVILFMGFPRAFLIVTTTLHFSIVAILVGVVLRGAAFVFRHYDPLPSERSQRFYTVLFGLSSLWTSFALGVTAASLYRGQIDPQAQDFYTLAVAPWWGFFPFCMGLFVVTIFVFLAAVYLIGETDDVALQRRFKRVAFTANTGVVVFGGAVFLSSAIEGNDLVRRFLSSPYALSCLVLATSLFGVLWKLAIHVRPIITRCTAATQVALILIGWYVIHAPFILITRQRPLSFAEAAAPDATLWQLSGALIFGSLLIFPSLIWLLRVFKLPDQARKA